MEGEAAGGEIMAARGEPSKNKGRSVEEALAESWSFLEKELEEFKKICDELDRGECLVKLPFQSGGKTRCCCTANVILPMFVVNQLSCKNKTSLSAIPIQVIFH